MGEASRSIPPPVPRRHPSRATLRNNSRSTSSDVESTLSTSADSQLSPGSSAAAISVVSSGEPNSIPSRPSSAIFLGSPQPHSNTTTLISPRGLNLTIPPRRNEAAARRTSTQSDPNVYTNSCNALTNGTSTNGQISPVLIPGLTFAGKVGLGSPKLDFHDWAKAGRPVERDASRSSTEEIERSIVDDISGLPSPPGTDIVKEIEPPIPSKTKADIPISIESTPTIAADTTPITKRSSTFSRPPENRSSLSVSPRLGFRANSSLAESQSTSSSSKRGSTDSLIALRRQQMQQSDTSSPRSSHGSSSPDKTLQRIKMSPIDRRRSKRMSLKIASEADGKASDATDEKSMLSERRRGRGDDLDERIREAEEKISKRVSNKQSPSVMKWHSPRESPNARAVENMKDIERSGGSSGSGRRKAIPTDFRSNDFHSGDFFTPSPKPSNGPLSSQSSRIQEISSASPIRSRHSSVRQSSMDKDFSSPSSRTYSRARAEGLERSSTDLSSPRRRPTESISGLSRHESTGRGGDRQRPESLMVTPFNQYRYRREEILDRELSGLRIGLTPNDSVSAVGSGSREKELNRDPLDVIRRLEEQRTLHNRRWEEDRANSVLGDRPSDRQQQRPSSRLDRTPHYPRPTSSMSSVRDAYLAGARTAPHDMQSRKREMADHVRDSPLTGRSSRMSTFGQEPRHLRASTSFNGTALMSSGRTSTGSTYELPDPSSDHGRIMLEAFRSLDMKLTDPELAHVFHASTRTTENLSALVRIASGLASDLAIGLEIDEPARLRDNATRLTMTLRDAARAADQNVRDLTQVMLELPRFLNSHAGGVVGKSGGGPSGSGGMSLLRSIRRSESSIEPFKSADGRWPNDATRWSTDSGSSPFRVERPSTSIGGIYSPSTRFAQKFSTGISELSRTSSLSHTSHASSSSRRGYEPPLQTIQASPPKLPTQSKFSEYDDLVSRSPNCQHQQQDSSHSNPILPPSSPERTLRHKWSTTSTQTLRANVNNVTSGSGSSFLPTSIPGPTTALSTVTADPEVSPPMSNKSPRFPRSGSSSRRGDSGVGASGVGSGAGVAADSSDGDSFVSFGSGSVDETANTLANAARDREMGRRISVSERFKEHLRRDSQAERD